MFESHDEGVLLLDMHVFLGCVTFFIPGWHEDSSTIGFALSMSIRFVCGSVGELDCTV